MTKTNILTQTYSTYKKLKGHMEIDKFKQT
jgi:hypothetical protein